MAEKKRRGSLFVASLGEVKLPDELERRVAGEIQASIIRALAEVDARGDVRRRFPSQSPFEDIQFPPHTQGIWIDPDIRSLS